MPADPRDTRDAGRVVDIGFILVPAFPLMAYAAAVEPLRAANELAGVTLYSWWHASPDGQAVAASNGVSVLPEASARDPNLSADRLFVCAGGNPAGFADRGVFACLRRLSRRGVAIGGISGGPYVLARAGLLEGRRCTIHWEHAAAFQETFPNAHVAPSLFEIDGDRITCSGGTAALDLQLHLIEHDHGARLAAQVSDWFVHNEIRTGISPQRMQVPDRLGVRDPRLVHVLEAIERHIEVPRSRAQLAESVGLSIRQLERLFRSKLGATLHGHYLDQRLAHARRLARETTLSTAEIATATGFATAAELRRAQRRTLCDDPRRAG